MEALILVAVLILILGGSSGRGGNPAAGCLAGILQAAVNKLIGLAVFLLIVTVGLQVVKSELQRVFGGTAQPAPSQTERPQAPAPRPEPEQPVELEPVSPCEPYDPPVPGRPGSFGELRDGSNGPVRHNGVDLLASLFSRNAASAPDKVVRSILDGTVRYAGSFGKGWGSALFIEHIYHGQPYIAVYGHITIDAAILERGTGDQAKVSRGQPLGLIDKTMFGPPTFPSSPHLHFGLWRGAYKDFPRNGWGMMPAAQFPGNWMDPPVVVGSH